MHIDIRSASYERINQLHITPVKHFTITHIITTLHLIRIIVYNTLLLLILTSNEALCAMYIKFGKLFLSVIIIEKNVCSNTIEMNNNENTA